MNKFVSCQLSVVRFQLQLEGEPGHLIVPRYALATRHNDMELGDGFDLGADLVPGAGAAGFVVGHPIESVLPGSIRLLREQEIAGSNPAIPITFPEPARR
jgi:hypothetical protein